MDPKIVHNGGVVGLQEPSREAAKAEHRARTGKGEVCDDAPLLLAAAVNHRGPGQKS
jgi:hypothetical protein